MGLLVKRECRIAVRKIVLIYMFFGSLWIYISDLVVSLIVHDPVILIRLSMFKGMLFIATTSIILYFLIGRYLFRDSETHRYLKESEDRFRLFVENANDVVFCLSHTGVITYLSPAWKEAYGYELSEVIGQPFEPFVHPEDVPRCHIFLRKVFETGKKQSGVEFRVRHKNGSWVWNDANASLIGEANSNLSLLGISRDITERKLIEKALEESEEQFRTLCDAAPIGIFRSNNERDVIYVNPRWEDITGISASDGMGKGWIKGIHPDDIEGLRKFVLEPIAKGQILSHEHRHVTPQGETIWVRVLVSPIYCPDGTLVSYVGTLEDITELLQARQDVLKTQKLESLGMLAGGIAHDFNNILTVISGQIYMAHFQLHDSEKLAKRLECTEEAISRATDLAAQLLIFARGGEPIKKILNVNEMLQETAHFVPHGSYVNCEFDLADDVWPLEADEGQFARVIHNLMLNAVQSMPNGGTVTIRSEKIGPLPKGGRFVKISIADTGTGISENDLERIFDPYFTTKLQGNGLGLATCYTIIKNHGGKIRVTSTVGEGTKFIISLPASENV